MRGDRVLGGAFLALTLAASAGVAWAAEGPGLTAFTSTAELSAFLDAQDPGAGEPDECLPDDPNCAVVEEVVVTGARVSQPSITNNQEVGVDEGDIVKARGDMLVILRRGRLFTVDTSGGRLRHIDTVEAYPPGADASGDWYDEMLVSGDRVIVIGYSYRRGGTEINRFRMDAAGELTFEDSHHLSSEDYYSSRNYASRLVGDELVVYTPVDAHGDDPLDNLPKLARWRPGVDGEDEEGGWDRADGKVIATVGDIFRSPGADQSRQANTLHTVVRCKLDAPQLTCRATAILGPESRSYYVAPTAVYVWMAEDRWGLEKDARRRAWLYRMPLDGGTPQAAAAWGAPIDQFSFNESEDGTRIDVLVVSDGEGDAMWGPEMASGTAALLQLPLSRFGDGLTSPEATDYRTLPSLTESWGAQNRFVGDYLLYADDVHNDAHHQDETLAHYEARLVAVPLNGGAVVRYGLPGSVGRIEAMGPDALVVSGDDDVYFTTIELQTPRPTIGDQYVMVGSAETESRSHAFFYRPDPTSHDGSTGVLGLPVAHALAGESSTGRDEPRYRETITYLRRSDAGRLGEIGSLDASRGAGAVDDGCVASCYGWYGDARPIFLGERIFALLGYEVVEGRERNRRMQELRRIDVTPPTPPGPRPYYLD